MWCDLSKEDRLKDCECPCVLWCNGEFEACSHWHEGKRGEKPSESVGEQNMRCSYSDIME